MQKDILCIFKKYLLQWVRQIFFTSHFSNKDDLLSFIKSDGSPLVKLIKLVLTTFSIWMIWHMRNYARFQDKIEVSKAISVIKDLTCLVENSSKASMKNDMLDFNVINLKFRLLWLLSFMELYMLWRKLKKWGLLVSGLNVILPWFVMRLLLGLMFCGCFVIDGILVLILWDNQV